MVGFLTPKSNVENVIINKLAPHLPVHLGSMSTCVRTQAKIWEGKLKRGDVIVSNHPEFGGTHLPGMSPYYPFNKKLSLSLNR